MRAQTMQPDFNVVVASWRFSCTFVFTAPPPFLLLTLIQLLLLQFFLISSPTLLFLCWQLTVSISLHIQYNTSTSVFLHTLTCVRLNWHSKFTDPFYITPFFSPSCLSTAFCGGWKWHRESHLVWISCGMLMSMWI